MGQSTVQDKSAQQIFFFFFLFAKCDLSLYIYKATTGLQGITVLTEHLMQAVAMTQYTSSRFTKVYTTSVFDFSIGVRLLDHFSLPSFSLL